MGLNSSFNMKQESVIIYKKINALNIIYFDDKISIFFVTGKSYTTEWELCTRVFKQF